MSKLTVWYDGQCPLCIREIALMRRLDKREAIEFIDVAEESNACPLDRDLVLSRFHAKENGEILSGASAFAAMWRAIPLLRPVGLAAKNGAILAILEDLYRAFLVVRPKLQGLVRRIEAFNARRASPSET